MEVLKICYNKNLWRPVNEITKTSALYTLYIIALYTSWDDHSWKSKPYLRQCKSFFVLRLLLLLLFREPIFREREKNPSYLFWTQCFVLQECICHCVQSLFMLPLRKKCNEDAWGLGDSCFLNFVIAFTHQIKQGVTPAIMDVSHMATMPQWRKLS